MAAVCDQTNIENGRKVTMETAENTTNELIIRIEEKYPKMSK